MEHGFPGDSCASNSDDDSPVYRVWGTPVSTLRVWRAGAISVIPDDKFEFWDHSSIPIPNHFYDLDSSPL